MPGATTLRPSRVRAVRRPVVSENDALTAEVATVRVEVVAGHLEGAILFLLRLDGGKGTGRGERILGECHFMAGLGIAERLAGHHAEGEQDLGTLGLAHDGGERNLYIAGMAGAMSGEGAHGRFHMAVDEGLGHEVEPGERGGVVGVGESQGGGAGAGGVGERVKLHPLVGSLDLGESFDEGSRDEVMMPLAQKLP